MNLSIPQWRYLFEFFAFPERIQAQREHIPEDIAKVEQSLIEKDLLRTVEDETVVVEFTDQGMDMASDLHEKIAPQMRGFPITDDYMNGLSGSELFDHYGDKKWFRTNIKKITCVLPPDAGAIFPSLFAQLPKRVSKDLKRISKQDRSTLGEFVKNVNELRSMTRMIPYAYQLGNIGGPHLIVFQSEDKTFFLPMQRHFFAWARMKFPTGEWFSTNAVKSSPFLLKVKTHGKTDNSRIYDWSALVMAMGSTPTWNWIPPQFEE